MRRTGFLILSLALSSFAVSCGGGSNTPPPPPTVTVAVSPGAQTLNIFGTQQFSAAVTGSSNTAVTWQVNGTTGGSQQFGFISSSGFYVAPSSAPTKATTGNGSTADGVTITITAVSQANPADSGTAAVTIVPSNRNLQAAPIELGTSGSNANDSTTNGTTITCCGGTLGSLVTRNNVNYILSNNHVLARRDLAAIGENITQPGLIDARCGRNPSSVVGNLVAYPMLKTNVDGSGNFHPSVDAAMATATPLVDPSGNILFLGANKDANGVPLPGAPHAGPLVPSVVGGLVAKSGRSTGLTCSTILATTFATKVQYQQDCVTGTTSTFMAMFTNQIAIQGGSFSAEGDSGSLIVTQDNADPVALLFAGSDTEAVGNPVSAVLNALKDASNNVPTFVGAAGTHQVIGCTLPLKPVSATLTLQTSPASAGALQKAAAVRDAHAAELLAHPEVQAVGVGASYDNPAEPAILFFVTKGEPRTNIPAQVSGVRTRIMEGDLFAQRGALSAEESAAMEKSAPLPLVVYPISGSEFSRAKVVHTAHADELMKQSGVQGVGITSSVDSPGEAALMIVLIRGVEHPAIPPVIDGLRTRVRESSRFRAGFGEAQPQRGCSLPAAGKMHPAQASGSQTKR